jgi:thiamine kinase-like enzyme
VAAHDTVESEVGLARILEAHGLTAEHTLDENDAFVVSLCRSASGEALVVKWIRGDSPDATRRLRNEVRVLRGLAAHPALRLLEYCSHGPDHLVTRFDPGTLLQPADLHDAAVSHAVLDALTALQSATARIEVEDRERLGFYYVKVMVKHLLHLVPEHVGWAQALRSLRIVVAGLPAIGRRTVLCHGDFIPTNFLYGGEGSVTLTDFEGCMSGNHPFFDLIALLTIEESPVEEWDWQPAAVRAYLDAAKGAIGGDVLAPDLRAAWRAIFVFYAVYRLNETVINAAGKRYFDGASRGPWLFGRLLRMLGMRSRAEVGEPAVVAIRKRNLMRVLDPNDGFGTLEDLVS